jgi:hypothetical protein
MRFASLVVIAALAIALAATAGERPRLSTLAPSSPCAFFRDRAWGKGLDHHATAMLWACEAVDARRRVGVPLGDRLEAVDLALARYREAVTTSAPADEPMVARASGALDALEGIALGF